MPKGMLPRETLLRLQDAPDSAVIKMAKIMHLAIHPQYLGNVQLGIINYFNNEITRFNTKLDGILLGYGKIRLKEPRAEVLNEQHHLHLNVHSDFWVFRPQINSILAGVINKKSPAHVSVLVHGLFNVPCYKNRELGDSKWLGTEVQVGSHVKVRILRMDLNQKIPSLYGELLETIPEVNVKEEPMDLILVENIKEEKVWEDITAEAEDHHMDNGKDEEVSTKKKKKKKKSKKESPDDDQSTLSKLSSSLVFSEKIENTLERDRTSPILSQIEDEKEFTDKIRTGEDLTDEMKELLCSSLLVTKKKKKKKKKNRSLSPSDQNQEQKESDESIREKLSASLLESLNQTKVKKEKKKSKRSISPEVPKEAEEEKSMSDERIIKKLKKKSKRSISPEMPKEAEEIEDVSNERVVKKNKKKSKRSISPDVPKEAEENEDISDERVKEELSNSLISVMLSKEKKKKKKRGTKESIDREDGPDDSRASNEPEIDPSADRSLNGAKSSEELSTSLISKVLFPEKKVKKRMSLHDEKLAILRQTVQDSKRKRSSSESSYSESVPAKIPKLESLESAKSPASPSSLLQYQESKLPAGWTYVVSQYNLKKKLRWFSPNGVKFNTLKAAQESIKKQED